MNLQEAFSRLSRWTLEILLWFVLPLVLVSFLLWPWRELTRAYSVGREEIAEIVLAVAQDGYHHRSEGIHIEAPPASNP